MEYMNGCQLQPIFQLPVHLVEWRHDLYTQHAIGWERQFGSVANLLSIPGFFRGPEHGLGVLY